MNDNHNTPEEQLIADALDEAGIAYERGVKNLDFFLTECGVYLESKGGHVKPGTQQADKVVKQLARDPNVILIQGYEATKAFCRLLSRALPVIAIGDTTDAGSYVGESVGQ